MIRVFDTAPDHPDIDTELKRAVSDGSPPVVDLGDRRDGRVFLSDPELRLAVRVALAAGRPLLLRGLPGTGKSSVASFVAERLGWRYYELTMTSETAAVELLWRYDAVRRLADAQTAGSRAHTPAGDRGRHADLVELPAWNYVEPGPLWWAQSPETAARRGAPDDRDPVVPATDPEHDNAARSARDAVVLIDEIDKAEPNVPNALLVPLGSRSFVVEPTGRHISLDAAHAGRPHRTLVVITTNEERELPRAFVRRCVVHTMPIPDADRMVEIAEAHDRSAGRPMGEPERALCTRLAKLVSGIQEELRRVGQRPPGTAEFLDAWRAARELGLTPDPGDPNWLFVEQVSLRKDFGDLLEERLG